MQLLKKFDFNNMVFEFNHVDIMAQSRDSLSGNSLMSASEIQPLFESTRASSRIRRLFWLLVFLRVVVAMDRGIVPACIGNIQTDLNIDSFQAGTLNSVYLFGLGITIPFCTYMSTRMSPFRIFSIGMFVWMGSVFGTGLAGSYSQMLIFRSLRGAGDAVFQITALPWIDRNAPGPKRAAWIALFQGSFALGIAVGTAMGGAFATSKYEWRGGFILVGALTTIPTCICACISEPPFFNPNASSSENSVFCNVLKNGTAWVSAIGFAGLMAVSVGSGFWTIEFCGDILGGEKNGCASGIGMVTVISGIVGTIFGGLLLDKIGSKLGGKSCALAHSLAAVSSLLCIPPIFAGYYVESMTVASFMGLYAVGIFFLMMSAASFTPGSLWTGPVEERVGISALIAIVTNLFGVAPAPMVTGWLKDNVSSFRLAMVLQLSPAGLAVGCWTIAAISAKINKIGTDVDHENEIEHTNLDSISQAKE